MKKEKVNRLHVTAMLAMLCAISIICGKYLAIRGGDILRFSFENMPIIFAGIAFGPVAGALVGVVADLIGCVLVGYAINPIVTLGACAVGVSSGVVFRLLLRVPIPKAAKVTAATVAAHLLGSVIIKTFGLSAFYDMPFVILMLWRLLNYVIVGAVEAVILSVLFSNKGIRNIIGATQNNPGRKSSGDGVETK